MATIEQVLGWFMSGEGRLIAAAMLFVCVWAMKHLPWIGPWIAADSGRLTSKRKKVVANVLGAMAPVAFMLTTDAPTQEVITAAVEIALIAAGVQGKKKAVMGTNP